MPLFGLKVSKVDKGTIFKHAEVPQRCPINLALFIVMRCKVAAMYQVGVRKIASVSSVILSDHVDGFDSEGYFALPRLITFLLQLLRLRLLYG